LAVEKLAILQENIRIVCKDPHDPYQQGEAERQFARLYQGLIEIAKQQGGSATEEPTRPRKLNKTSQTATSKIGQPASSCLHYLDARHLWAVTIWKRRTVMGSVSAPAANFFSSEGLDIAESTENIAWVQTEEEWRRPPLLGIGLASTWKGMVSRWADPSFRTREHAAEPLPAHYTICLSLRRTDATFSVDGRVVHNGGIAPGICQVTAPGVPAYAEFRAPCDFIHVYVQKTFVEQCFTDVGLGDTADVPSFDLGFRRDATIEQLVRSLTFPQMVGPTMGPLYVGGVCLALIARLISVEHHREIEFGKAKISALPNWRLKRALAYIDANIAEPISLGSVADAAGLTRMYFAAQFRAATGVRPHEFILRRRIERAQDMLLNSGTALVEIALSVGFQTQAHFTTVFKKIVGQTPHRWREANLQCARRPGTRTSNHRLVAPASAVLARARLAASAPSGGR
jgi:AraC-like DNA-binding protein